MNFLCSSPSSLTWPCKLRAKAHAILVIEDANAMSAVFDARTGDTTSDHICWAKLAHTRDRLELLVLKSMLETVQAMLFSADKALVLVASFEREFRTTDKI